MSLSIKLRSAQTGAVRRRCDVCSDGLACGDWAVATTRGWAVEVRRWSRRGGADRGLSVSEPGARAGMRRGALTVSVAVRLSAWGTW